MVKTKSISVLELQEQLRGVDEVTKSKGYFFFRRGYFYTNGHTALDFHEKVLGQLRKLGYEITESDRGDHWAAFKGGAKLSKSSHWWVKAKIELIK